MQKSIPQACSSKIRRLAASKHHHQRSSESAPVAERQHLPPARGRCGHHSAAAARAQPQQPRAAPKGLVPVVVVLRVRWSLGSLERPRPPLGVHARAGLAHDHVIDRDDYVTQETAFFRGGGGGGGSGGGCPLERVQAEALYGGGGACELEEKAEHLGHEAARSRAGAQAYRAAATRWSAPARAAPPPRHRPRLCVRTTARRAAAAWRAVRPRPWRSGRGSSRGVRAGATRGALPGWRSKQ
eukprot:scaffold10280_cov64-Phaeocystis_antarctica.AAC.4